jgi:hypothetical protein
MPFNALQAIINTVKTRLDAIDSIGLACDLHLKMSYLRHDVRQARLKPGHTCLELSDIRTHLILPAPNEVELFHDEICRFVDHDLNLVQAGC